MTRAPAAFLILAVLAACSFERGKEARQARSDMIGMSRAAVERCAGPPQTVVEDDDRTYLIYYTRERDIDARLGRQPNEIQKIVGADQVRDCRATIQLRNGIVSSVSYSGNTGGLVTQGEACHTIVKSCIPGR